ncbi:hypothetical protein [Moorena sp. SIO4G3]|nr:hypothetical protein [Moorena sp. SIO4G3]NEO80701.1 hypothetical protein [Moorena sp. SIO4G3]
MGATIVSRPDMIKISRLPIPDSGLPTPDFPIPDSMGLTFGHASRTRSHP